MHVCTFTEPLRNMAVIVQVFTTVVCFIDEESSSAIPFLLHFHKACQGLLEADSFEDELHYTNMNVW